MHLLPIEKTFVFSVCCFGSFFLNAQIDYDSVSVEVRIAARDLSEDLSVISSKNDEIMLVVYEYPQGKGLLTAPLLANKYHFDQNNRERSDRLDVLKKEGLLFFLLEIDAENSLYQTEPILRVHYEEIISCYEKRDYLGIEKYLGDDDILGVAFFDIPSKHSIKGVYKLDKFDYTVTFQD